jgi:metal-responsive CopG/Arc/MetJ family transcriptional regulator
MARGTYDTVGNTMPEDIIVRLPPNLIIKLERRAAHIGVSRTEHITSILRASLESGRPVILRTESTTNRNAG